MPVMVHAVVVVVVENAVATPSMYMVMEEVPVGVDASVPLIEVVVVTIGLVVMVAGTDPVTLLQMIADGTDSH